MCQKWLERDVQLLVVSVESLEVHRKQNKRNEWLHLQKTIHKLGLKRTLQIRKFLGCLSYLGSAMAALRRPMTKGPWWNDLPHCTWPSAVLGQSISAFSLLSRSWNIYLEIVQALIPSTASAKQTIYQRHNQYALKRGYVLTYNREPVLNDVVWPLKTLVCSLSVLLDVTIKSRRQPQLGLLTTRYG